MTVGIQCHVQRMRSRLVNVNNIKNNKLSRSATYLLAVFFLTSCGTPDLDTIKIPTSDPKLSLAGTIFQPIGKGPFPLVVLSHGTPSTASKRAKYGYWYKPSIVNALTLRGFAVIVPIRRGHGATGGEFAGSFGDCSDPDFYNAGLADAEDILATLRFASGISYIDNTKIILFGYSAGGFASIATANLKPKGVIAIANFSGGRGGVHYEKFGIACFPGRMTETIGRYAENIDIPVLWHYVENDVFFPPDTVTEWFQAFKDSGGNGKLIIEPPYKSNGHKLLVSSGGVSIWGKAFDDFLVEFNISTIIKN